MSPASFRCLVCLYVFVTFLWNCWLFGIKLTGHPTQFTLAGKDRVRERVFFFDDFFQKWRYMSLSLYVMRTLCEGSLRYRSYRCYLHLLILLVVLLTSKCIFHLHRAMTSEEPQVTHPSMGLVKVGVWGSHGVHCRRAEDGRRRGRNSFVGRVASLMFTLPCEVFGLWSFWRCWDCHANSTEVKMWRDWYFKNAFHSSTIYIHHAIWIRENGVDGNVFFSRIQSDSRGWWQQLQSFFERLEEYRVRSGFSMNFPDVSGVWFSPDLEVLVSEHLGDFIVSWREFEL